MEKHFEKEVDRVAQKIKELKRDNSFCFCVLADSHCYPPNNEWWLRQEHTFENVNALNKSAPVDAIFHLGDLFWTNYSEEAKAFWSAENTDKYFDVFLDELRDANKYSFFVAGNHDNYNCSEPNRQLFFEKMIAPKRDIISGIKENELYYYVDFPEAKIRAIILMSSFKEGKHCNYGIYPEQVAWLRDEALLAPEGYGIMLFSHLYPENDEIGFNQDNAEEFFRFLWAFKNREKNESELFPADFRNIKTDAEILALFVGHGHVDWIAKPSYLPFYTIETGANHVHVPSRSNWRMPEDCTVAEREYGTVSEDLFDVVLWNPDTRSLDIIRFGAGEDRKINL